MGPEWTFVTKHAVTLSLIANNPRITALELAGKLNMTERATRKLIAELYEAGYIRKRKEGRRVRYIINLDQPLRHENHGDVAIGSLLETLGWKGCQGKQEEKQPQP